MVLNEIFFTRVVVFLILGHYADHLWDRSSADPALSNFADNQEVTLYFNHKLNFCRKN